MGMLTPTPELKDVILDPEVTPTPTFPFDLDWFDENRKSTPTPDGKDDVILPIDPLDGGEMPIIPTVCKTPYPGSGEVVPKGISKLGKGLSSKSTIGNLNLMRGFMGN